MQNSGNNFKGKTPWISNTMCINILRCSWKCYLKNSKYNWNHNKIFTSHNQFKYCSSKCLYSKKIHSITNPTFTKNILSFFNVHRTLIFHKTFKRVSLIFMYKIENWICTSFLLTVLPLNLPKTISY